MKIIQEIGNPSNEEILRKMKTTRKPTNNLKYEQLRVLGHITRNERWTNITLTGYVFFLFVSYSL